MPINQTILYRTHFSTFPQTPPNLFLIMEIYLLLIGLKEYLIVYPYLNKSLSIADFVVDYL